MAAAINQQNVIYLLLALYSAYYYPRMLVIMGFMILAFSVHLVVVSYGFASSPPHSLRALSFAEPRISALHPRNSRNQNPRAEP